MAKSEMMRSSTTGGGIDSKLKPYDKIGGWEFDDENYNDRKFNEGEHNGCKH